MSPRPIAVACTLLAAFAVASCQSPASDVGKPCILVKRDPADTDPSDGIRSIPVKEFEVTEGKDFISFGSTECDDYVCVRDKDQPKKPDTQADAVGYCSKPCAPSNPAGCAVAKGLEAERGQMTCRGLLLDEDTIGALCREEPDKCQRYLGSNRTTNYCARLPGGPAPDGGNPGGDGGV